MRSGDAFQAFGRIDRIVFDKTGTLTQGKPRVVAIEAAPGHDQQRMVALAAAVEDPSEHSLSRAIVEHADESDIDLDDVADFEALTGAGVRGTVHGHRVLVGKPVLATEIDAGGMAAFAGRVAGLEDRANTVVVVVVDEQVWGLIAIANPVKEEAAATIAALHDRDIEPVMLTGDNARTAAAAEAFDVARDSYRRTKQNLALAFAFNGIGVPLATTGLVHPAWAMAAMATSVTVVLLNSFGLGTFSPTAWRRFANPDTNTTGDSEHHHQAAQEASV